MRTPADDSEAPAEDAAMGYASRRSDEAPPKAAKGYEFTFNQTPTRTLAPLQSHSRRSNFGAGLSVELLLRAVSLPTSWWLRGRQRQLELRVLQQAQRSAQICEEVGAPSAAKELGRFFRARRPKENIPRALEKLRLQLRTSPEAAKEVVCEIDCGSVNEEKVVCEIDCGSVNEKEECEIDCGFVNDVEEECVTGRGSVSDDEEEYVTGCDYSCVFS
jgi:hypothetical protein